jgi:hypothetical protein
MWTSAWQLGRKMGIREYYRIEKSARLHPEDGAINISRADYLLWQKPEPSRPRDRLPGWGREQLCQRLVRVQQLPEA